MTLSFLLQIALLFFSLNHFSHLINAQKKCPKFTTNYKLDNTILDAIFLDNEHEDLELDGQQSYNGYILRGQMTYKNESKLNKLKGTQNSLNFVEPRRYNQKMCSYVTFYWLSGDPSAFVKCFLDKKQELFCNTNLNKLAPSLEKSYENVWGNVRIAKSDGKNYMLLVFCKDDYLDSWFLFGNRENITKTVSDLEEKNLNKYLNSIGFENIENREAKGLFPHSISIYPGLGNCDDEGFKI